MTVGLVLAAGAGRRFAGEAKQLALLDGRPLLEHAVAAANAALDRVVVVLGARADEVRTTVDFGTAEVTVCPDWAEGQAASLRHGLGAVGETTRVIVLLGDQPLVPSALIARIATAPPRTRVAFGGRPGHPVVLGPDEIAAARELRGDQGLKDLVRWRMVEVDDELAGRDVDTREDLAALREQARPRRDR